LPCKSRRVTCVLHPHSSSSVSAGLISPTLWQRFQYHRRYIFDSCSYSPIYLPTAIGSPDCLRLLLHFLGYRQLSHSQHGWLAWGIEAQEKRSSISFSSCLPTLLKARDSESAVP